MVELLNTLYVLTQGAVLRLEHDTVRVQVEGTTLARLPLLRLGAVVVFGRVTVTPFLIQRCAEDGRSLVWLDRNGRFKARIEGPIRGNVLLRRSQHLAAMDHERTWRIARQIVAGKIQNSHQMLQRGAREADDPDDARALRELGGRIGSILKRLATVEDLEAVRGCEGEAARLHFAAFRRMLRVDATLFGPDGRSRRPPRDPANAILSFLYALLRAECSSGLEAIGLDPQVGFLHSLRPGRPALALDLMEELRPVLADRLALTLLNRRQLRTEHFESLPGGAVQMTESGRRTLLAEYQRRKQDEVTHAVLQRKIALGLIPHVQARLLARHLRGDLAHYPPFVYR
ncbi:MAG: type I-C CRISPR-associated endonuclease Cas1c [Actinomycetota bacterium]